ncbi:hypothetical protein AB5J72_48395 [Streptomyces sp. CG1]|uniref:hypothetical protein n=1 Tax=Streptomyces sp. CG1 TaxID=1287523 RepID=UPI0034E2AE5D
MRTTSSGRCTSRACGRTWAWWRGGRAPQTASALGSDEPLGGHLFPGTYFYGDEQIPVLAARIVEEVDIAAPGLADR